LVPGASSAVFPPSVPMAPKTMPMRQDGGFRETAVFDLHPTSVFWAERHAIAALDSLEAAMTPEMSSAKKIELYNKLGSALDSVIVAKASDGVLGELLWSAMLKQKHDPTTLQGKVRAAFERVASSGGSERIVARTMPLKRTSLGDRGFKLSVYNNLAGRAFVGLLRVSLGHAQEYEHKGLKGVCLGVVSATTAKNLHLIQHESKVLEKGSVFVNGSYHMKGFTDEVEESISSKEFTIDLTSELSVMSVDFARKFGLLDKNDMKTSTIELSIAVNTRNRAAAQALTNPKAASMAVAPGTETMQVKFHLFAPERKPRRWFQGRILNMQTTSSKR